MRVLEANKESRNETKMENDAGSAKRRHCLRANVDAMSIVFSLLSFAFCFLLSFQNREIKDRVVDLEIGSGTRLLSPFHGISMDQFNSMIQERLDELLSQVCVHPQPYLIKSTEHLSLLTKIKNSPHFSG